MMKTVTDPLTVANDLRPVLLKLSRQVRRELHELDVTAGQVSVLAHILQRPGIGVGGVAALEGVSAPRMSKVVQELLAAGLVASERAGADRRRVGLSVTPLGDSVIRSVKKRRTAWLARRLERLEPAELDALEAALEPLAKLLEGSG
jgi:DNA-binding MarR family transcriptional regulator